MEKYLMAGISIAVLAISAFYAIRSIRIRRRNQSNLIDLGALVDLTALDGTPAAAARGQYVATVFRDRPLERVVTGGLMHRGKAQVVVTDQGVGIERVGEESFAIPAAALLNVGRASAAIDRGVEADGLVAVDWTLGTTEVTTLLRIDAVDDGEGLMNSLKQLVAKDGAR